MRYELAPELNDVAFDIVGKCGFYHIDLKRVVFVRSYGSKAYRTLARIHGMAKIMQIALKTDAVYAIEIITENFDKLSEDEKLKTIIHELMHIPANFGGGFRQHKNYVNTKTVEKAYREYKSRLSQ
jgi:predicted metallopeptidase